MEKQRHVIYGPPGTGKSTEMIRRLKNYITQGYKPYNIGLCSFTKTASEDLAERSGLQSRHIGTIHSLAFRKANIIREQVIDYKKLKDFEKICGIEISGLNPEDTEELKDGDYYLALYSLHKALLDADLKEIYRKSDQPGSLDEFLFFCEAYVKFKELNGYVDFNDMLVLALKNEPIKLDILFIDEAQDLSPLQWKLIEYWILNIPIVHISGDDDQAIYEWGGADPEGMFNFEKKHNAKRVILNQSWRIPKTVHNKASEIIKLVSSRVEKEYRPREENGLITNFSEIEDCFHEEKIKHGDDVLILYRNHVFRSEIEEVLMQRGLPYIADNGKAGVLQGWYKDVFKLYEKFQKLGEQAHFHPTEYRKLLSGMHEFYALKMEQNDFEIFKNTSWDVALKFKDNILQYFKEILLQYGTLDVKPTLRLSTIHGSKGKEAQRIILINGMSTRTHDKMYEDNNIEKEARVFYVGVTRAKQILNIVTHTNSVDWV